MADLISKRESYHPRRRLVLHQSSPVDTPNILGRMQDEHISALGELDQGSWNSSVNGSKNMEGADGRKIDDFAGNSDEGRFLW